MALTKENIRDTYPLPVYNYKVVVDTETLSFSEVSGLSVSYEKVVYKHGLSYLTGPVFIRAQQAQINVTLKRGVASKRTQLYDWFAAKAVKDVYVELCDEKGNAVVRWKVSKALPFKMDSPTFTADGTTVAIESIELVAHEISIEYL